jgi:hypothetical protein
VAELKEGPKKDGKLQWAQKQMVGSQLNSNAHIAQYGAERDQELR